MSDPVQAIVAKGEILLMIGGVVLLGWLVLLPALKRTTPASRLQPSSFNRHAFLLFVLYVIAGMFIFALVGDLLARAFALSGTAHKMVASAGAQLGWIVAVAAHWYEYEVKLTPPPISPAPLASVVPVARESFFSRRIVLSGVATFLIALPVVLAVTFLWRAFLMGVGIVPRPQDLVGMFAQADSQLLLALMIVLAVVLAPVSEELVFRRGLFRYLKGRTPRLVALLAPAIVFSALHQHFTGFAPLAVLAVVLALAYERTGHIGTPIIAHALFNLNTLVLVLTGTVSASAT